MQSQLGITGAGIVVGGLDTGVRFTHQALSANYKCAGTSHSACWFDAISGQAAPYLVAPGVNIRSAWNSSDTSYTTQQGTSMAAPHVTGLVALLLQVNPSLTISQLTANMKANALGISATACSSTGIPNNLYGWGRIRAYESVLALGGVAPTPTSPPPPTPTSPPPPTPTPPPNSSPTVSLVDWSVNSIGGSSSVDAYYYIAGSGDIYASSSPPEYCPGCVDDVGDWLTPKVGMSNYEVIAFNGCATGPYPYGTYGQFGTWKSADTAGAWGVYIHDINQSENCSIVVQIRAKNNPSVILDTATVYFNLWTGT